jgi:TolB protein
VAVSPLLVFAMSFSMELERRFSDYMAALNGHDLEKALSLTAPDLRNRDLREWEASVQARFEFEVVSTRGEWLTARIVEENLLYSALDVNRRLVVAYRFENEVIEEIRVLETRENGRPYEEALPELEAWLAEKPGGALRFTGENGRRLVPLLAEWRGLVSKARLQNEAVVARFIESLNAHDVDAQYRLYTHDMAHIDEGRRVVPRKDEERADREFEGANGARWSYVVLGAGLDSLELVITEDMEFYRSLGVGARSHRARYRFRDGKIREAEAREWFEAGRPYDGARDLFTAWLKRERPGEAARITGADGLNFDRSTAPLLAPLAREWRKAEPCRIYHPSISPTGARLVVSSDCEGAWGIYVMDEDGTRARRVSDRSTSSRLPRWSPDGSRVIFQTERDGTWNLTTVGGDGSGLTELTHDPASETSPAFSPDGRWILFNSDRSGANELYLMPAEGGEARPVTSGKAPGFRPIWSSGGDFILYRGTRPPSDDSELPGELFRVRPDGTELGVIPGGPRRDYNHAYSPDGARIAFDAHREGKWDSDDGLWEIWLMDADGSDRRPLTHNDVNDWAASWSPDGERIVFLSGMRNVYDVYTMSHDGSDVRRLTRWTETGER